MAGQMGRSGSCIGLGWVGSSGGRRCGEAVRWSWAGAHTGAEKAWFAMGPTSLSLQFSSSVHFFVSQHVFCLHVVSPADHSCRVCLAKIMTHSKGHKRSLGYLVLPFQAASYFIIASRIQAAGFLWIKSPVFFTHLRHCLCRCDLVCDLSGPELPPPDGCPLGAGRRVAVPIAR